MLRGQSLILVCCVFLAAYGQAAEICETQLNKNSLYRAYAEVVSDLENLGFHASNSPGIFEHPSKTGIRQVRVQASPAGHAYTESISPRATEWTVEEVRDQLVVPEVLRDWNVLEVFIGQRANPGDIELRIQSANEPLNHESLLHTVEGFTLFKRVMDPASLEKVGVSRWQFLTVVTFKKSQRKIWAVERFSGYFHELFFDSAKQRWRLVPADYKVEAPEPLSRYQPPPLL